jgi:hypothetical protein
MAAAGTPKKLLRLRQSAMMDCSAGRSGERLLLAILESPARHKRNAAPTPTRSQFGPGMWRHSIFAVFDAATEPLRAALRISMLNLTIPPLHGSP